MYSSGIPAFAYSSACEYLSDKALALRKVCSSITAKKSKSIIMLVIHSNDNKTNTWIQRLYSMRQRRHCGKYGERVSSDLTFETTRIIGLEDRYQKGRRPQQ